MGESSDAVMWCVGSGAVGINLIGLARNMNFMRSCCVMYVQSASTYSVQCIGCEVFVQSEEQAARGSRCVVGVNLSCSLKYPTH
jgi:hypothetical protein